MSLIQNPRSKLQNTLGRLFASVFPTASAAETPTENWNSPFEQAVDVGSADLVRSGRYCHVLANGNDQPREDGLLAQAWKALEKEMALVPTGETRLLSFEDEVLVSDRSERPPAQRVTVRAMYLDRYAVTNRQFARFVAAGGYGRANLWPPEILPFVLQCVDTTGAPGPRYWAHGKPPQNKLDHPVVGVSWYEAHAYSQWIGKRLPTPAEWQRAGSWCSPDSMSGSESKYPWGNAFEPTRANTWYGGRNDTVSVDQYANGATGNGVYQLIGNVWEWVAAIVGHESSASGTQLVFEQPMAEIRGGAFDTYFSNQATCQFRTGQPLVMRADNVGFRCCVSVDQLRPPPNPSAFLE